MTFSANRPWTIPLVLLACFAAGIVLSLVPGLPSFIGALLAAVPVIAIAWKLSRATR